MEFLQINDWFLDHPEYVQSPFGDQATIKALITRAVDLTGQFSRLENAIDDGKLDAQQAGSLRDQVVSLKKEVLAFRPSHLQSAKIAVLQIGNETDGIHDLVRWLGMLYTQVDLLKPGQADLAGYGLVWIHLDGNSSAVNAKYCEPVVFPTSLLSQDSISKLRRFVEGGGGLVCTGMATALVKQLGLETKGPNELYWGPMYTPGGVKMNWETWAKCGKIIGLKPFVEDAPLFKGLGAKGFKVESYDEAELISKAVWRRSGGAWPKNGRVLAGYYSDGADIPNDFAVAVEYHLGKGKILLLGDVFDPYLGKCGVGGRESRWKSPYHTLLENIVETYRRAQHSP
jgi:hypothetical protein